MPFVQAKCPNCGGMLAVDDNHKAAICNFCGNAFIVQEAVNNYITNNITNHNTNYNYGAGAVVNVYEDKSKDFVIEAGVLKEYHGASADVVIPDTVEEIGPGCFMQSNIKSVTMGNSVKKIGIGAFEACHNLTTVTIGNGVTKISDEAFQWCTNLTTVKMGGNLREMSFGVFRECRSLTSIVIPGGVKSLYKAFTNCYNLSNVTIGNGVTCIGSETFMNCVNLRSIVLPNSVTEIGIRAFSGCNNLASVQLGNNVTKIEPYAFSNYWKSKGLCQRCGGTFKGLLSSKCSKCRSPRDY